MLKKTKKPWHQSNIEISVPWWRVQSIKGIHSCVVIHWRLIIWRSPLGNSSGRHWGGDVLPTRWGNLWSQLWCPRDEHSLTLCAPDFTGSPKQPQKTAQHFVVCELFSQNWAQTPKKYFKKEPKSLVNVRVEKPDWHPSPIRTGSWGTAESKLEFSTIQKTPIKCELLYIVSESSQVDILTLNRKWHSQSAK